MRIGPMRHRITIQEKSTAQNSFGEESIEYSDIALHANVWANVRPASGSERYAAGADQNQSDMMHRVEIRYRSDLSVEMQVVWEARNLEIHTLADPSGKRQSLVLICREVLR